MFDSASNANLTATPHAAENSCIKRAVTRDMIGVECCIFAFLKV